MSSSSSSKSDQPGNRSRGKYCGGRSKCGNWSGLNIATMVLGFVLFWPIGLLILYWNITGRNVKDLPQAIRHQWSRMKGCTKGVDCFSDKRHSDNAVFDEFQQTQHDRIDEIKEEIKVRSRRFGEFRADAKRRADEEEFNQFMADTPANQNG